MKLLVIWFGKLLIWFLQLIGKNGSALPGLIVEKIYPSLLQKQLDQLEDGVVIVTGTNGKTTTTKVLVYMLEQCKRRVLTNPTGSNFTRGIYATVIKNSSLSGGMKFDIAVLELDEAFSRKFAAIIQPRGVVALNVMRDQLDRYGEIDTTAEMISDTAAMASEYVVLNANDNRIAAMSKNTEAKVSYFGVSEKLQQLLPSDDEMHGHRSKHGKNHDRHQRLDVMLNDYKEGSAAWTINSKSYRSSLQVSGLHNAVNITAALTMALQLCPEMKPQFMIPTVANIASAFGRGEIINVAGKKITLILVKNPSGLRQSLNSYADQEYDSVTFAINDNYADGRDVSWLWDVNYDSIENQKNVYVAGIRAKDMALRLRYDDIKVGFEASDMNNLVDEILTTTKDSSIIYCTYTAMLDIRKVLSKHTDVEGIW